MRPWLVALVLLAGCGAPSAFGPEFESEGLRLLLPVPHQYVEWYAETEDCLNTPGRFEDITWWVADKIKSGGQGAIGLQNGDWIVIQSDFVLWRRAVRHESAHHIVPHRDIHFNSGKRALCDGG